MSRLGPEYAPNGARELAQPSREDFAVPQAVREADAARGRRSLAVLGVTSEDFGVPVDRVLGRRS